MTPVRSQVAEPRPSTRLIAVLCVALALATLAVYIGVYHYGFIEYDDNTYVFDNPVVKKGLTSSGLAWAFTTFHGANWHPLTWLSHMLDCQLFGSTTPGAHHLVNLGFHLANTLLLFIAFVKMTNKPWRSSLVAAIFALHPLHVESVAWIAERKDVLSTFLGLVSLLFYVRYTKNRTILMYAPVILSLALALMAKPMLVTLPFLFLLLDIWPLERLPWPPALNTLKPLLTGKIPLFVMVAASSIVTFIAQRSGGAVSDLTRLPFKDRLATAAIAYISYIAKSFWPTKLAVLYPYQAHPSQDVFGALVILIGVTIAAFIWARRRPYVLVGWLWYIGMLVPVIGLVQVGAQSMADRYTYLPLVGLSVAAVWLAADLIENRRLLTRAAAVAASAALVVLAVQAHLQARYWKSGEDLFVHALAVTERNHIIQNNLGVALASKGRNDEAILHYSKATVLKPDYAEAHGNLGHELMRAGRFDEAYSHLVTALEITPSLAGAHADLGTLLAAQGKLEDARSHLEESIRIDPGQPDAHSNLGFVLQRLGRIDDAITQCNEALRLKPDSVDAHYNLATALTAKGQKAEAIAEFSKVLALSPAHPAARAALDQLQGPK
jgi:tetratricopeptide (TPR) repeat protein